MSFVTTQPEALLYAAGKLETLGSALTAESAAAAPPTTAIAPAASDEISALQAALFNAYGHLYQSIRAQATAIHEQYVHTLGTSAGSYRETEAANTAAAQLPSSGRSAAANALSPNAATDPPGDSPLANVTDIGLGNFSSATSDLLAMAGGGLLVRPDSMAPISAVWPAPALTGAVSPPASSAGASMGVGLGQSGLGQAASVGRLSVPPSWGTLASNSATPPTTATLTGWIAPAPQSPSVAGVPAGVPAMATAGRAGGLGAPRYGVKPTVMPKPTGV
ncbi:MAG: PE domain-containing protein [Mycobacterium sp.]|uniref:PPE family protein, SVP subgroup n=1 Tax=Mycobacterium sp. TaxID=1785 RepID=UPI001EBF9A98|nr:PE domain-containing protein [Mycobacterium sp.]MBV8785250.1 PE domain-containing protein [Mycobacterium sp.]